MSQRKRPYAISFGGKKIKTFSIDNNAFVEARALANSSGKTVRVLRGNLLLREYQPEPPEPEFDREVTVRLRRVVFNDPKGFGKPFMRAGKYLSHHSLPMLYEASINQSAQGYELRLGFLLDVE